MINNYKISFMKQATTIFLLMLCSFSLSGQDVSEEIAVQVASEYYEKIRFDTTDEYVQEVKKTLSTRTNRTAELISPMGISNLWLIPVPDGWVIVSTNMKTRPILAHFQTAKKPDFLNMPPAMEDLLTWYEETIAYAKDSCFDCQIDEKWTRFLHKGNKDTKKVSRATVVVRSMIKTRWSQTKEDTCIYNKYYNKFCPPANNPNNCDKSPAGCNAVAMAQIMCYWGWPFAAQVPTTQGGSTKELHFYDWSKMPSRVNQYSSMEGADMVAGLLRDCGYMAKLTYHDDRATGLDVDVKNALVDCGFDNNTISKRDKWSTPGWRNYLHNDLDAGRPVYYSAKRNSPQGLRGHTFIVDGYDSDDLYFINFGWGSNGDGFYNIDTIFVDSAHIYKHWHSAIFGIQPAPNCGSLAINTIELDRFCYASGGELTLNNFIVSSQVDRGEATSATQVRLTSGTAILSGCNVRIGIKDVPCPNPSSAPSTIRDNGDEERIPTGINTVEKSTNNFFAVFPNPAMDRVTISSSEPIAQTMLYNLNGQLVLQTAETTIDVSSLSAGVYIVHTQTFTGQILTTKIVHL